MPQIGIGNKPIDGGHYLFTPDEKREFLRTEPGAEQFFKRWYGSREFLNGVERWCRWLGDASSGELAKLPESRKLIQTVRDYRLNSTSKGTVKLAETPTRFHVENMPGTRALVIPESSSM